MGHQKRYLHQEVDHAQQIKFLTALKGQKVGHRRGLDQEAVPDEYHSATHFSPMGLRVS